MEEIFAYSNAIIEQVSLDFKRYLFKLVNWDSRLIEILGSRGVGKTSLMLQKARILNNEIPNQAVYISLDDRLLYDKSLVDLADGLEKYGIRHLFLDEVHKYPSKKKGYDWSAEIKNIYDRYRGLHIVYSGSSALKLYKGQGDLSRRKSSYHLAGLSFREYLEFLGEGSFPDYSMADLLENHQQIAGEIVNRIRILPLFREYLRTGFFPFFMEDPPMYYQRLNQTLNVVIETDIPAVSRIGFDTSLKIKKLLSAIATTAPYVPNLLKLRNELGIADQRTLLKYLDYLDKSGIVSTLQQVAKGNKVLQKPDKIYLGNTNLVYSLNTGREELGTIRETFFHSQAVVGSDVQLPPSGDFLVDGRYTMEIGGKGKTSRQIKDQSRAFIVADDIETGAFNRIPLWLFGFLY